jgi:hypothetical protein
MIEESGRMKDSPPQMDRTSFNKKKTKKITRANKI